MKISFDLFGALVGKAVRRRIEAEVAKGGGPILSAVLPAVRPIIQAEAAKVENAAVTAAVKKISK